MKRIRIAFLLLLLATSVLAQNDLTQRIVLIGDAGQAINGKWPVLDALKATIALDSNTSIIYLGDNEYAALDKAHKALAAQAAVVDNTAAKAYFLPGHADWDGGDEDGEHTVIAQNEFLKSLNKRNIFIYPENGCAGVGKAELGNDVLILFMDTQWWLHKYSKPGLESKCDIKTPEQLIDELKDKVQDNAGKLILFASHHPLRSNGLHSNSFGVKQHLFPLTDIQGLKNFYLPLPIIGSAYPVARNFIFTRQDRVHPAYTGMIQSVEAALEWHPYLLRVAGHDHGLQLIESKQGNYYIGSGAGSHAERIRKRHGTIYKAEEPGFSVVEVAPNKRVSVTFYTVGENGKARKAYTEQLFDFSKQPPLATDTAEALVGPVTDSATVAANSDYDDASSFKRFMLGSNYRKVWATPAKMKVFRMDSEKGGLEIETMGGGKQSRSLHMKDANGMKWTLRSINKDPNKAIPAKLRGTIANDLVQDLISSAHPYAPLTVPPMAKALGMVHTNPELVFVPNDTALGKYAPLFANTVCMLEERYPSRNDDKGDNSWETINTLLEKDDYTVDQQSFLTARMFDMLVADFDRHYDQWRWGKIDTGKGKVYYPIPKDRDQTYVYNNGFIIKLLAYNQMPFLKGLKHNIPKIRWLGYVARDIDRLYLNQLTADDWKNTLADFRNRLTDTVIDEAMHRIPAEVYPISGPVIGSKLKSRRDVLPDEAMKYYDFLSEYVTIIGSNKKDYFKISGLGDNLLVQVYDRNKDGDTTFLKYSRVFSRKETKEVWLYGFNGNDYFDFDKNADSRIKVRVVGGRGSDTVNAQGEVRNFVYDLKSEDNAILNASKTRRFYSRKASVHDFNFKEEAYTSLSFPKIAVGYNSDDQLLVGLGVELTIPGFRKVPYGSNQRLTSLYSFFNRAYQLKYDGEFIGVYRSIDLLAQAQLKNPALDFFFGLGNETVKDETKRNRFYQARYNYLQGDLMIRRRFFDNLVGISIGPSYYKYWSNYEDNKGKVLENPTDVMLDSAQVYTPKLYAGGKLSVTVNNIDNKLLPTHGIDWRTDFTMMTGLDESTQPVTKLQSDVTIYATLTSPGRLVSVFRFGGGHIFSEHFEFFQAFRMGANNYLRGYRRDRFAGSSMAYGNAELRLKLFEIKSKILPGDFGLIAFDDIGRVWMKGEESNVWHNSYGGGFYFTPFNMVSVGASMAFSNEDKLFNASVGTNIRVFF